MVTANSGKSREELLSMIENGKKISTFHYLFKIWINRVVQTEFCEYSSRLSMEPHCRQFGFESRDLSGVDYMSKANLERKAMDFTSWKRKTEIV